MKITNNRSRAAWFNYRVDGMPKRVFLKGYETREIADVTDIDQSVHNRTIGNFTDAVPDASTAITTNIVSTKKTPQVNTNKPSISTNQQTDGNWEIEYTT